MGLNIKLLQSKAKWLRCETLKMVYSAGKGHIGGSLSCIEILTALYYGNVLRLPQPKFNPSDCQDRDRFILSKGHACAPLYAILADLGYFDKSELDNYGKEASLLEGHACGLVPGIEVNSGSLGHGLGIGAGMALAGKLDERGYRTIVLMGDGELCEGSIWEATMLASRRKLNNLIAIVDRNNLCVLNNPDDCVSLDSVSEKFKVFGWAVINIDGHDYKALENAFRYMEERDSDKPLCIIAHTIKGKGVSFMENVAEWHHRVPDDSELEKALAEIG